jgi:hypothetical protein
MYASNGQKRADQHAVQFQRKEMKSASMHDMRRRMLQESSSLASGIAKAGHVGRTVDLQYGVVIWLKTFFVRIIAWCGGLPTVACPWNKVNVTPPARVSERKA